MSDTEFMRLALRLARRGYGCTSPNPMVGAVLVRGSRVIGRGWHRAAGQAHAEVEAIEDARRHGHPTRDATLYVTLEPCSTHGRTPPCTDALLAARLKRVVVGATDPNPRHAGRAYRILRRAGMEVVHGMLADECARLNEAFNHWIVHGTPFVTVKAAMTLDGKIATAHGESKWITSESARKLAMKLRQGHDAILVGINTILADDPSLTVRNPEAGSPSPKRLTPLRRIILDARARTPLTARVVSDAQAAATTVVVSPRAPAARVAALAARVRVLVAPLVEEVRPPAAPAIDLHWLMGQLGAEQITSLLVEGGGEVNASFLFSGLAHRVAFFYAPKILGGRTARKAVAGRGITELGSAPILRQLEWRRVGPDIFLTALVGPPAASKRLQPAAGEA